MLAISLIVFVAFCCGGLFRLWPAADVAKGISTPQALGIRESEREGRITSTVTMAIAMIAISSACDRSPSEKYARLIEQSAAWAAAGEYADELRQQRYVPDAYLRDLVAAGLLETGQLHQPLVQSPVVLPAVRDRAAALNDQVRQQFEAAAHTHQVDAVRLHQLYTALRALADSVRAAR
jgi:hypothetical protein